MTVSTLEASPLQAAAVFSTVSGRTAESEPQIETINLQTHNAVYVNSPSDGEDCPLMLTFGMLTVGERLVA